MFFGFGIIGLLGLYVGAKIMSIPLIFVSMAVSALFQTGQSMGFVMLADVVDYGEWKTGVRSQGLITSCAAIGVTCGAGIAGWLSSFVLEINGFVPNQEQAAQALNAININFVWIPIACCAIGTVLMLLYKSMIRSALFVRNSQPVIRSLLSKRTLSIALRASKRFDPNSLFRSKPGTFVLQTNKEIIMSVMEPAVFTVERADGTSLTLRGTRYLPEGFSEDGHSPVAVLFHGFGGNRIDFSGFVVQMARELASRGLVVVTYDRAGHGESDGTFFDTTVSGDVEDALQVVEQARHMSGCDPDNLHFAGLSLGAVICTLLAPKVLGSPSRSLCVLRPLRMLMRLPVGIFRVSLCLPSKSKAILTLWVLPWDRPWWRMRVVPILTAWLADIAVRCLPSMAPRISFLLTIFVGTRMCMAKICSSRSSRMATMVSAM